MARGSGLAQYAPQYAVLAVLGMVAFNWAEGQQPGTSARKTADEIKASLAKVFSHTTPGTTAGTNQPSPPKQAPSQQGAANAPRYARTSLVDFGQIPVVFDANIDSLRQDPAWGGTNIYKAGDSFYGPDGMILTWTGRADVLQGADGAVHALDEFFA